jgi:HD-GYP domain-containing protein (c-di-GMP phosphodiesterase class II)
MIYDLILKNIEILKEKNIGFKIKIDNQIYDNHKNGEKLIEIEYRKDKNIEVIFFEELDSNYIISLDKLFKEFCGIEEKREKNIMFKMLSKMQPNIELKKTIKNIENIFIEDLNVKKIDFYFNLDLKILKETNFYLSSKEKIKFSKFLKNEIFLPINLEDGYLGYFKLVRDQSFDLFDVYIIKILEEHIRKNIENSFLENKFNIILDKSLKILTKILEVRVPGSEKHCENVLEYSQIIADEIGMSKKQKENLKYGSLLFDIGKIGVPENLLKKKGKLNKEEKDRIRKHVNYGYDLLSKIPAISQEVRDIVLYHHEKWNGTGYPEGLSKEAIPLSAQIIGLLDKYLSLIEERPNRKKMSKEEAFDFLEKHKGEYFNPKLVDKLKEVIKDG